MKNISLYDPRLGLRVTNDLFLEKGPFDFLQDFLGLDPASPEFARVPAIDVGESEEAYLIEAELPGLSEKDVKLEVKDSVLTLKVETTKAEEDGKAEAERIWHRRERRSFAFTKAFSLPDNANEEAIEARFKDGVLSIVLPKRPEKAPRQVQVKVA